LTNQKAPCEGRWQQRKQEQKWKKYVLTMSRNVGKYQKQNMRKVVVADFKNCSCKTMQVAVIKWQYYDAIFWFLEISCC
jgi:hypothetical protein